ncbi:MAG TPA: response regulator [Pirellulales bacterium]|nr:response regulator [Pirellulales bacterium]
MHFLLVDDLDENLLALDALLRRDELVLLKARSGPEALELLLEHDVALALVDVQMPGMDGFELAELMRGTERTRRVPLIFLTAGADDRQRKFRGYEAGAVDFLHKPIDPDILRSKADVFFDLYRQREEVARQRDELKTINEENARLLDESRRSAQALREADRRKDEFLAMLAHELRNPLAPIRNGVQLLQLNESDPKSIADTCGMMQRQLQQLVRLVDDLLDVSRITRNKLDLRIQEVELSAVVDAAVETSRPLIEQMRHELTIELPEEPIHFDADAMRLAQVFSNLLNNGAKYTEPGGRISLVAVKRGDEIEVRVSDTGIGISEAALPKVFEMFSQVEQSSERVQGGLGIGLTLVRRLVEMHGGSVEGHSQGPGKGSEFVVHLPIKRQQGRPLEHTEPRPAKAVPSRRILVVDDSKDSANSLGRLLRLLGNEVQSAYEGSEAIKVADAFRPDVMILDIGLPKLNGYEVCRRIRRQPWGREIMMVAMTGWGQDEDRRRSREAGFDHHLVKPIELASLEGLMAGFSTS